MVVAIRSRGVYAALLVGALASTALFLTIPQKKGSAPLGANLAGRAAMAGAKTPLVRPPTSRTRGASFWRSPALGGVSAPLRLSGIPDTRGVSCSSAIGADGVAPALPEDVSDEADIEVRLFILQQQLKIRYRVAMNKGQEDVAKEMKRSIEELEGLIEERDGRWSLSMMDDLRRQLDDSIRNKGPERIRRNLFRKIEAIMNPQDRVEFKLGTKVIHTEKRYTGVVCGYHPGCRETDEWVETNNILKMPGVTARPFYMVLVDVRDVQSPVVTYVPENMLETIKLKDYRKFLPKDFLEEQNEKPPEVVHPFVYSLFYGQNSNGDYLPTDELMNRYGEVRR